MNGTYVRWFGDPLPIKFTQLIFPVGPRILLPSVEIQRTSRKNRKAQEERFFE